MNAPIRLPDGPLVAWYGDDFTGSAAVMEVLSFNGYPSVLFFDIPTPERLARFEGCRGIGIAGVSRSKEPAWMERHLPQIFGFLDSVGAPIRHYKVCSTLDSSPGVGSIGKAIDLAVSPNQWVPIIIGAPAMGRYQAFGNLFATAGDGVFRLDRHPTMSVHPVTPMGEADIGRHLEKQTEKRAGNIDLAAIKAGRIAERVSQELDAGRRMVTFDIVDRETSASVGKELWRHAKDNIFVVGSQGVEYALIDAWSEGTSDTTTSDSAGAADRIAVVSGSCSPVTEEQIRSAELDGFAIVEVNPARAVETGAWAKECEVAVDASLKHLANGLSPLVCTARGPADPSIARFEDVVSRCAMPRGELNERVGVGLGRILRQIVVHTGIARVGIAGGDTSSHGAQQLGLYAVTARAFVAPGASLLAGHADEPNMDGLEIALKGGQMGPPDYFSKLRDGDAGTLTAQ